jgi:uncharacterized phage protein (TIGR02216 family)
MRRRFPWADYMAAGLGQLKLPPQAFWAATPREILAAFAPPARDAPNRAVLEGLLQLFPDET